MPPPALAQPGTRRAVLALPPMLVHQRIEDLLAEARHIFAIGLGSGGHPGPLQGGDDLNGIAHDVELQVEIPVLRVAALQGEETKLTDRETQVLQLFDVKPGTGRNGTRDQPGEHNEVAAGRELELYPIADLQSVGRLRHAAPADSNE